MNNQRKPRVSTLSTELRNKLEHTIVQARDVAETGAKAALETLAVHHYEPYGHMSPEERKLRKHLRARTRQLGDKQTRKGELEIIHLIWECAYEHWHRMLFARFLAENNLLIEPEMGVAISLEECEELAKEEGKDLWTLASEFAQRMLPQIFRTDDPILKVALAHEHRIKLEKLLDDLEPDVFTASDSLGWVYQFWQSKRKKEVNKSGNKIGADELPAVTQLFTEPYMVSFLLDNSLGSWWAARQLTEADLENAENEDELRNKASLPGMPLEYLRFVKLDNGAWIPAAGIFDGWPEHLSEFKALDPCCGSGNFLVAAFLMLVIMRMELEGLSACDSCDAVLRENIHGLEIDRRCVELAAFALALTAWCYPDAGGYRPLPELNVACSGLSINAKKKEWLALAGDNTNLRMALEELYKQFKDAPVLGSLINPEINLAKGSLFELKWEEVSPLLKKALSGEKDDEKTEMGVVVQGIAQSSNLLSEKYNWVVTNVPYKKAADMVSTAQDFFEQKYPDGKKALETVFALRLLDMLSPHGVSSIVLPQNWMFLTTYKSFRQKLLWQANFSFIARLGAGAFETISGEVVKAILFCLDKSQPKSIDQFFSVDTSHINTASEKARELRNQSLKYILQSDQLLNPDSRIVLHDVSEHKLLLEFAGSYVGLQNGDTPKYVLNYWEINTKDSTWDFFQMPCEDSVLFTGRNGVLKWEKGIGELRNSPEAYIKGTEAWGKNGIAIRLTKPCPCTLYNGSLYDQSSAAIIPYNVSQLPAIWAYCLSSEFRDELEKIDQKRNVTNATFVKVPFDLEYWQKVAAKIYPNGMPKPYSDDPTQWIFHGHPAQSEHQLQVAVGWLLGYRWPAELDAGMELADEQREWVNKCDGLLNYVDEDGIVCIPSVRGEETAEGQLRALLTGALGADWSPSAEQDLIRATGVNASNLDEWLRDHFFEQHCKLFHHRPFVWHIWDGRRRDGFHALVNYHKLAEGNGKGRQLLEKLTYAYLGDWITRQKEGVKRGEGGAEDRLASALELQKRLIVIVEGEPPFDIFVRWKPIENQPIGWEPDINDGVRLNIRPFMAPDMPDGSRKGADIPGGRKGAGILRWKPNIKWNKDRGKEPSRPKKQYPWFWKDGEFTGDRVNDIHLSINDKQKARKDKNEHEGV
jgi:hypothetical protein